MNIEANVGCLIEPLTGRRWDPPEIRRQILRRARAYLSAGIEPGDRVFIHFGNRLEFFCDTPWYVSQPRREVLDFSLTDEEIEKLTYERIKDEPSLKPFGEWRAEMAKKIEKQLAAVAAE